MDAQICPEGGASKLSHIYTIEKNKAGKLFTINNLTLFHRKQSQEVVDSKGALKKSAKRGSPSKSSI
jgi:hypothetical protein